MITHAYLAASDQLHRVGGQGDGGSSVHLLAESRPVAPAGPDLDCEFDRLFLTLSWKGPWVQAQLVSVTPIVDDFALSDAAFSIDLSREPGTSLAHGWSTKVWEQVLRRQTQVDGMPPFRYVCRGTWFAVRIECDVPPTARLSLDSVALEFGPLQPTTKERT